MSAKESLAIALEGGEARDDREAQQRAAAILVKFRSLAFVAASHADIEAALETVPQIAPEDRQTAASRIWDALAKRY